MYGNIILQNRGGLRQSNPPPRRDKKLENQLRSFGKSTPETQIRQTEERLATTRQEFVRLTTEAAKAGAVMESDFKKKSMMPRKR